MRRLARYWPVALLMVVILGLGWSVYYRAVLSEKGRSDLLMLRDAGRAVLDGNDIYEAKHPRGWPFYYPPTMAVVMAPFALLPLGPAVVAWYALSMGALLWAGYRLVRLCDELSGQQIGPLVVAAFLVNFGPIIAGLQRGQVSALLFALMVEAFWSYRRGHAGRSGWWIALAASLKLYPALLILLLILRREWRGLGWFAVGLVLLSLALPLAGMGPTTGWEALRSWTSSIAVPFVADPSYADREVFTQFNQFSPSNQSFFGVLARWLARGSLPAHEPFVLSLADLSASTVRLIGLLLSVGLLLVMALVTLRRVERSGLAEAVVWCLPMVAANFICHVAWHHYYAVLTMAYALAGTAVLMLPEGRARGRLGLALGLAVACNWLHFAVMFCRQMGLLLLGSLLLWAFLALLAARWGPNTRPQDDKSGGE